MISTARHVVFEVEGSWGVGLGCGVLGFKEPGDLFFYARTRAQNRANWLRS